MDITILCSSQEHPVYPFLQKWVNDNSNQHNISLVNHSSEVQTGDILFLISCLEIIKADIRNKFKHTLVIHESDLPHGKGWSPIQWQILEGKNSIPITLLDAADKVDSGDIWEKRYVELESHELANEINAKIFPIKLDLMDFAIQNINTIKKSAQKKIDEINDFTYHNINNGVYKVGFATKQSVYEEELDKLFTALDQIEEMLKQNSYLLGDEILECDLRLFPTLLRFDPVYVGHFKCNKKRIIDYPNISRYLQSIKSNSKPN